MPNYFRVAHAVIPACRRQCTPRPEPLQGTSILIAKLSVPTEAVKSVPRVFLRPD